MLTIKIPVEIEERLATLAHKTQKTESFFVSEALERTLEDMEDAYLAESAYKRFKASGEEAIPIEKVMQEYDMER